MRNGVPATLIPFGLLEVDATGTILLYEPVRERPSKFVPNDIVGRNFFTEVVPFSQTKEIEKRFRVFVNNGEAEQRFTLSLRYNHGRIRVRFLLARLTKQALRGLERIAIVQISPEI